MIALLKKEISVFFSTLIGYLIIGVFLLINSILLWSDFSKMNILEYGYADMDIFFSIAPLLFLLFIPAISMRIFTEEYTSGTMETLITKPITAFNIVLGKFLAIFTLILFAIIPTLIYVVNIYYLGEIIGNLDLTVESMNKMKETELNEEQMFNLAKSFLDMRVEGTNNTYNKDAITEVLDPQRSEDMGNGLWEVFNRVQENIIEGNFEYLTVKGKSRQARIIKNFKQDQDLNKKMFSKALEFVA